MCVRWVCTVRGETNSRAAISLLLKPSLTRRTTSCSVGVSDAQPLGGRLRSPRPRCAYPIASSVDSAAPPDCDAPLIQALINASDPQTGRPLTDDEICRDLIVFMLGGHDTTATTLTYALWQLGRSRNLQDRVVAEVSALGNRPLTTDDVPRLGYTVQVLDEALRLCPAAPAFARMIDSDIEVDGYRLEAGTFALLSAYAMHRDPALWDDPLTFDPDRFTPERSKGRNRWQYIPFGGGPRKCIGDHFAMLEATLALATIVRTAEISSVADDFPLAVPFTAVAAAPILATIRRRPTP